MLKLGFDLGGTKTEAVLLSESGEVLTRQRQPTPVADGAQAIVDSLARLRNDLLRSLGSAPSSCTIGLGTPGSLSPSTQKLRNSNTQCLNGLPLQAMVEEALGQAVAIENDANCFALAEALAGAGQGYDCVFGVIMGTGCGGGFVINGQLRSGPNRLAGEWGHVAVDPNGPACWCGQKGCLETYISGSGLEAMFRERFAVRDAARPLNLSAQEILQAYEAQRTDLPYWPTLGEVTDEFLEMFGRGLAQVCAVIDPDVIVLGGGLSNSLLLYKHGPERLRRYAFGGGLSTPIVKNGLGDSAGVIGAAWLGAAQLASPPDTS
ncbi:MAG: ROK family protein [Bordetella sp.]|jgi:fructokinase